MEVCEIELPELTWLRHTVNKVPLDVLQNLVAHRGFHCIDDGISRPLENTFCAYDSAWSSGVRACECDIGITSDGQIFLGHDDTFARLSDFTTAAKPVSTLHSSDLCDITLKDGQKAVLLSTILDRAMTLAPGAEPPLLIIEIKHSYETTASALSSMLLENQQYRLHVPVVMSFSKSAVRRFAQDYGAQKIQVSTDKFPHPLVMQLTACEPKEDADFVDFDLGKGANEIDRLCSHIVDSSLSGAYIEFQHAMLETAGQNLLRSLCDRITVGVWSRKVVHPDNLEVAILLQSCGVQFVNTDLPTNFHGLCGS
eukprot:m.149287 g.149287  ORF g.149287 m.149287 type:complete len:311 (+) comp17812_c0_seq1:162-1094(+)